MLNSANVSASDAPPRYPSSLPFAIKKPLRKTSKTNSASRIPTLSVKFPPAAQRAARWSLWRRRNSSRLLARAAFGAGLGQLHISCELVEIEDRKNFQRHPVVVRLAPEPVHEPAQRGVRSCFHPASRSASAANPAPAQPALNRRIT